MENLAASTIRALDDTGSLDQLATYGDQLGLTGLPDCYNLADRLAHWATIKPDGLAFRFLVDAAGEDRHYTYSKLDQHARAIAADLAGRGWSGERVLLLFPPGLDFVAALFGCFYAGSVAVPTFPPRRNRNMARLEAIISDAGAKAALTTTEVIDRSRTFLNQAPQLAHLEWIATDEMASAGNVPFTAHRNADLAALLQYTSGSTGTPKGVMLSQRNLIHNCSLITYAFETTPRSIGLFWLPTYHDMGLVGGVLNPLYVGRPSILMSPVSFLHKPSRWLKAITRHRVTISGGPNFAYELCAKKITDEELAEIDLSTWELAFNGAEPIRASTLEAFCRRFGPYGFRREAFYSCYGMAESTLMITGGQRSVPPKTATFAARALERREAVPVPDTATNGRAMVGCGRVLPGETVLIVDPETSDQLEDGRIGEVWVRGPSVGLGYFNQPGLTKKVFEAGVNGRGNQPLLRTGDLGFFHDEELFIAGRLKDLVIIRGANYYPQDIELSVEQSDPRLRVGATAAFSIQRSGREELIVVAEVERNADDQFEDVISAIRRNVAKVHEIAPDSVVLVRAGSIPKTTSGKIQRKTCREGYLQGNLNVVAAGGIDQIDQGDARGTTYGDEPVGRGFGNGDRAQFTQGLATPDTDVLSIVIQKVREVARERATTVNASTNIIYLGLDSMERLDVANRIERHFGGLFPEDVLAEMETCGDVAAAVETHLLSSAVDATAKSEEIPRGYYDFAYFEPYLELKRTRDLLESAGGANPYFRVHEGAARDTTVIDGREVINFSSYNYLGMSGEERVAQAAKAAVDRYGTSVSASRLVSGERPFHRELESSLAEFLGVDDALTFIGGHATNETTIGHLVGEGDLILHDELSHNSIMQGAQLSGARRRFFPHNDWRAVDKMLASFRGQFRRVLIIVEGVYSMDGDFPQLPRLVEIKQRHQVFLMVDEAHSFGTMGKAGRGIGEHFGLDPRSVDIWMGTLSKALGSCGGYIAGSRELVDYLRFTAPGFVFSIGLPPCNAAAALESLRVLQAEPERVERCAANARLFADLCRRYGFDVGKNMNTPVIPVILGSSRRALLLSERLFDRGINVQPILYPAVEERAARLRFFLTACHTESQIRTTVATVRDELAQLDTIPLLELETGDLPRHHLDSAAD